MDAVLLSRIQFAVAAGFHFIFPPITLGMTLIIIIIEGLFLKSRKEIYKTVSTFLVKILALVFTVGVATGIVLEFSFGTNWSKYSRFVGDIFGAPLAAEGVLAFFMESTFIGILLFGREKVSPVFYFISTIMVFIGSHLSGLWIIIANSWMQTPAGYTLESGKAVLADFWAAAFNPSTLVRYLHTVLASWITGSLFLAGISAWYCLKDKYTKTIKPLLKVSLLVFIATAFIQLLSGHSHSVQVAKTQPAKMAAFEALWQTTDNAPLSLFGFPDPQNKVTNFEVRVPGLLSYLIHFDTSKKIAGLNEFNSENLPPISLSYYSYHIMIGLGTLFLLFAVLSVIFLLRKTYTTTRWFLYVLLFSIPLPIIANEVGWMAAEVGRQPWIVFDVLKTSEAVSPNVPAGQILFSLIMFSIIYLLLFVLFLKLLRSIIKKGPLNITSGY